MEHGNLGVARVNTGWLDGIPVYIEPRTRYVIGSPIKSIFGNIIDESFFDLLATFYTLTEITSGTGNGTLQLPGGGLQITGANVDNDGSQIQRKGNAFKLVSNQPLWFMTKVKLDDVDAGELRIGLAITDTTLIAGVSDGVYFDKAAGSAALSFTSVKDTANSTSNVLGVSMSDDTFIILGFYWDGEGNLTPMVNEQYYSDKKISTATDIPDDELLTPSFAFLTSAASSRVLTIDNYIITQKKA